MFTAVYIYRVPREHVGAFLAIQREALAIYRAHGALDDETLAPVSLAAKYGCAAFDDALPVAPGEEIFISLGRFRDRAHHDAVLARVDADPRIGELYAAVGGLLDIVRIARGEFARAV